MIFFILCQPLFSFALEVPKLQGHINDYAGMISPATESRLAEELKAFEESDSTQIVILTVPSLEGENIESFGIKVAEAWKIGQKNKDNGLILIVAKEERKIRIEVGKGLEGRLTDLLAGRIIDLSIKPRFKRGDFEGGFTAGVSSLIVDAARGELKAGDHPGAKNEKGLTFLLYPVHCIGGRPVGPGKPFPCFGRSGRGLGAASDYAEYPFFEASNPSSCSACWVWPLGLCCRPFFHRAAFSAGAAYGPVEVFPDPAAEGAAGIGAGV